jgi:hypothetical protein
MVQKYRMKSRVRRAEGIKQDDSIGFDEGSDVKNVDLEKQQNFSQGKAAEEGVNRQVLLLFELGWWEQDLVLENRFSVSHEAFMSAH